MREEEGGRYLSPLAKQELGKLDTGGGTRRLAVKSPAEQPDSSTLPRFLSQAWDGYRLDRMPHVRAAVSEALHTAKMLASGNAGQQSPGAASPSSQVSRRLSFSSASTSSPESMHAMRSSVRGLKTAASLPKRAPLYSARNSMGSLRSPRTPRTPGTSRSSSTTTVEECQSPSRRLNVKEFNMQIPSAVSTVHDFPGEKEYEHVGNSVRPWAPLQEVHDSDLPPFELLRNSTTTDCPNIIDNSGPMLFPIGFGNPTPSSSDGEFEVFLPLLNLGGVNNSDQQAHSSGERLPFFEASSCLSSNPRSHSSGERIPILETSSILSSDQQSNSCGDRTPVLQVATFTGLETGLSNAAEHSDASSHDGESATADVEVEKRQIFAPDAPIQAAADASQPSSLLQHFHKPLAHTEDLNLEIEENVSKDLLEMFVTPKRLVHSLSSLSTPGSDQDQKLNHEELTVSPSDAAETGSETGWSVRDNPNASQESEVSPKQFPERSPREICMISPCNSLCSSSDHASPREHTCSSCGMTEQILKARDAASGLSCLQDETKASKRSEADETRSGQGLLAGKWRKPCWYMETALLGLLCLAFVVPLVMVIAKSVAESFEDSYYLVPT